MQEKHSQITEIEKKERASHDRHSAIVLITVRQNTTDSGQNKGSVANMDFLVSACCTRERKSKQKKENTPAPLLPLSIKLALVALADAAAAAAAVALLAHWSCK